MARPRGNATTSLLSRLSWDEARTQLLNARFRDFLKMPLSPKLCSQRYSPSSNMSKVSDKPHSWRKVETMKRYMRAALLLFLSSVTVLAVCGLVGCKPKQLTFSSMDAKASAETGPFGGRYVAINVSGSLKNDTSDAISSSDLPQLVGGDVKIAADLAQDELKPGETCDVTWKQDIDYAGKPFPELAFSGGGTFEGLDEAQATVNEGLKKAADQFVKQDEDEAAKKAAEEKQKKAEEEQKAAVVASLEACKGKTADEALKVAEGTEYKPAFVDSFDVDVTADVTDAASSSAAHSAKVTEVKVEEEGFFSVAKVTFVLDYVDPAAKKEREKKEASDQAKKELANSQGKTVAEVLQAAKDLGVGYTFKDPYDKDVTSTVENEHYAAARERTTVTEVVEGFLNFTFTMDRPLSVTLDDSDLFREVFDNGEANDELLNEFIEEFEGLNIEFDGNVAYLDHSGNNDTLYDILIYGNDFDDYYGGVAMQFKEKQPTSFEWQGAQPDSIYAGMNLHIVAEVDDYNSGGGLLLLDPVVLSTR